MKPEESPFIAFHKSLCVNLLTTDQDTSYNVIMALMNYYYGDGSLPEFNIREKLIFENALDRIESEREKYFNKRNAGRKTIEANRKPTGNQEDTNSIPSQSKSKSKSKSKDKSKSKSSSKEDDSRHRYGEFKNVLLTDEEFEKITDKSYIERLSYYMASTGKTYKSHYVTILNWIRRDGDKKPENSGSFDTDEFFEASLKRSREQYNGSMG